MIMKKIINIFIQKQKKNNSPESIKFLCDKLAKLRNIKYEDLAKNVYNNSLEVLKEFL